MSKGGVKKLMPGWAADDLERSLASKRASDQATYDSIKQYQAQRRRRLVFGRDLFTGMKLKPRHVDEAVRNSFGLRFKKPTTIIPEGTAMIDAANEGVISEPDTPEGRRDWEKYKNEIEHGKRRYQKYVRPND
jgi:hypothetical protein